MCGVKFKLVVLLISLSNLISGQSIVTGTAIIHIDETISKLEAKALALQKAKVNALESFGVSVNANSSRTVSNRNGIATSSFNSTATLNTMGIWAKMLDGYPVYSESTGFIECEVKGYAIDLNQTNSYCQISAGIDSNQFVFRDSEPIPLNILSTRPLYTYIFANKIGSNDVIIVKSPQNKLDKLGDSKEPIEISISLDNRNNIFEEYNIFLIQSENFIELEGRTVDELNVPDGYQKADSIPYRQFSRLLVNLLRDRTCCIEEIGIIITK